MNENHLNFKLEELIKKVPVRSEKFAIKCALSKGILSMRLQLWNLNLQEFKQNDFRNRFKCVVSLTYTIEDSYNEVDSPEALPDLEVLRKYLTELRYLIMGDSSDLNLAQIKINEINFIFLQKLKDLKKPIKN